MNYFMRPDKEPPRPPADCAVLQIDACIAGKDLVNLEADTKKSGGAATLCAITKKLVVAAYKDYPAIKLSI